MEHILEKLEFVEWDRLLEFKNENGNRITRVFGWIEREDEYKDFVHLEFLEESNEVLFLGTSSKQYSEKIHTILYGEDDDQHVQCRRVENQLDIENVIEIEGVEEVFW